MKKIIAVIAAVGLIGFGSIGMADPGNGNNHGEFTGGIGGYKIKAGAMGGAVDCDIREIPNGIAGGISGAGGIAGAKAKGKIRNGSVGGDVTAVAGGLTVTNAYRFTPCIGDKSIGVGSSSQSEAVTGASAHINVDPSRGWAGGGASACIGGIAAQGTLNGSMLTESPRYFSSTGVTGGIAGQGSIGGFVGGAVVGSGPDICNDSRANADVGAHIAMNGSSYSESSRFVDWNGRTKTEGMGTMVGARTDVVASGHNYDYDQGLGYASSHLCGGYIAVGGAATKTAQIAGNRSGGACASAIGIYAGAGSLNSSYSGSANGYSRTSITTVKGMNGSINTAASGMQVTSVGSSAHNNL